MQPADYNFPKHYSGDGLRSFNITLQEDGGEPINLTGASVKMQLRSSSGTAGGNVVFTFETDVTPGPAEGLVTISDPTNGVITFAEIKAWGLGGGKYYYDLEVTDSTGFVSTYLKGLWEVNADITK